MKNPLIIGEWDGKFAQLEEFKKEHGHCDVSKKVEKLGPWVMRQRRAKKTDKLSKKQIVRLDRAGFKWSLLQE